MLLLILLPVEPRSTGAGRRAGTVSIWSRDSSSVPAEEVKIRDPPLQLEDYPSQLPSLEPTIVLDPEFLKQDNKMEQEEKLPYSVFSASSSNASLYYEFNDNGQLSLPFRTFDFSDSDPQVFPQVVDQPNDQSIWDPLVG